MGQRILVFEQDNSFAGEIAEGFGELGADVEVVSDGEAGLAKALESPPDLILLSVELPSGYMLCKRIKKESQLKNIPLVVLSTDEKPFEHHRKLKTHAEDYIRKPVGFSELLERVQQFVSIGNGANGSDVIDIDLSDPGVRTMKGVDEEIDAFAESAFDALSVDDEQPTTIGQVPEQVRASVSGGGAVHRGKSVPPAQEPRQSMEELDIDMLELDEPGRASAPVERNQASRPTPGPAGPSPDLLAAERRIASLEEELETTRSRAAQVEVLEKEIVALRTKVEKGGGVSSREFLDLREQLNRKDRDILNLNDQLATKDKQLLDLREKTLGLERQRADVQDSVLVLERKAADAEDQIAALTADKAAAAKRGDDLKARLERSEGKTQKVEKDLDIERQARAADAAQLTAERDETIARLKGEHAVATQKAAADHAAAIESARKAQQDALAAAEREHAAEKELLEEGNREALAELKGKHAVELEDLKAAHESALGALRAELGEEKQRELAALGAQHRQDLETKLEEAQATAENELKQAKEEYGAAQERMRADLVAEHELAIEELKGEQGRELAALTRKLTEAEGTLSATQEKLEATESARARIEGELETTATALERAQKDLSAAQSLAEELDGQASRARKKIETDSQILERAHKATAIALALLDEQRKS